MKTLLIFAFSLFLAIGQSFAGGPNSNPQPVLTYRMIQSEGTNASAVTWNPKAGYYYTVIAGNADYPLEVFDARGNGVRQYAANSDMRGLWWNAKAKSLQGNCAGDKGWIQYDCNKSGIPTGNRVVLNSGQNQPDFQSVGTLGDKGKSVVFYHAGTLSFYNSKSGKGINSLELSLPVSGADINATSVGYTGQKNYEYVLLDFMRRKLYFFNTKGEFTGESSLPTNAVTNSMFRFSFANGNAFLYDVESRSWTGYKVF
ncbi:MAG: hypothetical protein H6581_08185 [Bacteroidia bacterium]|nr:hypothetical protein [Bacteroidia bacterium]